MVPVDLSGTGLERATVDAAREQAKDRSRKPATAGGRYWVIKGVLRCAECGASIPPHTVKRYRKDGSPGKPGLYYQCRSKYNDSPWTCTNTTSHPAEALEAAVWDAVHELLRNPERAQKAYEEELERRRKEHGVDPKKEAKRLSARLQEIETERRGYQRLAARGSMSDDELDAALAGLKIQKDKLEEALGELRGRRNDEEELRRLINMIWGRYAQIRDDELRYLDSEDKRRVLRGAKVRAEIDREGRVKITGMLDLDIAELLPVDGPFCVDSDKPEPPPFKGVVEIGNARWNASA